MNNKRLENKQLEFLKKKITIEKCFMIGPQIPQEYLNKKLIHVKKYGQNTINVQEFTGLIDFDVTDDTCIIQVQGQSIRESLEIEVSNYNVQIVDNDFMLRLKEKDGVSQIEIYFSALDYFTEFVSDLLKQNQVLADNQFSDVEMENEPQDLPLPTQENLLHYNRTLLCELPNFLIAFCAQPQIYMKTLIESFRQNVIDRDGELLDLSFQIAKNMFFCNDEEVIDILTEEQYFIPVLEMLEYCPNRSQRLEEKNYRQLFEECHYKELFSMKKEVSDLIHKNFRLKFLNDVALAQFIQLEEFSFNIFTHMMDQNNVRVVKLLINGQKNQLIEIFQKIDTLNEPQKKFVTEWINISKNLLFKGKLDEDLFRLINIDSVFQKIISSMQNANSSIDALQLFLQIINYMSFVEIDTFLRLCCENNKQFWNALFVSFIKVDVSIMEEVSNLVNRIFYQLESQEQKVEVFLSLKLYFLEPLSKYIQNQLKTNINGIQAIFIGEYFDLIVNVYGVLGSHTRNFLVSERGIQKSFSQKNNSFKNISRELFTIAYNHKVQCDQVHTLTTEVQRRNLYQYRHIRQTELPKIIINSYTKLRGGLLQSSILSLLSYIIQDEVFSKLYQFMKLEMIQVGKLQDIKKIEQNTSIKEEKEEIHVEKQLDDLFPLFEVIKADQAEFQMAQEPKITKKLHIQ